MGITEVEDLTDCLKKTPLKLMLLSMRVSDSGMVYQEPISNKSYRFAAYRSVAAFIFGNTKRQIIPCRIKNYIKVLHQNTSLKSKMNCKSPETAHLYLGLYINCAPIQNNSNIICFSSFYYFSNINFNKKNYQHQTIFFWLFSEERACLKKRSRKNKTLLRTVAI